jgi:hypothetical protein
MKGKLLTIIFTCFTLVLYSQTTPLKAKLILLDGDTLKGKVLAKPNVFSKTIFYESSINQRIRFIKESGEKVKFKDEQVSTLEFTDLKGQKRTFVSKNHIRLLEVLYDGKLKWYRDYFTTDVYQSNQSQYDLIFDENGKEFKITMFNSMKNKLKEVVKDDPELSEIIKNSKMEDDNVLKILQLYDKKLVSN